MSQAFFANFDLASLSIWLFYIFFAGLVIYLQRENMREGYPLEDDDGNEAPNQGPFPIPEDKTFLLPHGRGELTVPSGQRGDRKDLALARTSVSNGYPMVPTGNPLVDGVGPASWAPRNDEPELDGHGHPKIVPMGGEDHFRVAAGPDPRGRRVVSGDGKQVGTITDMWIDAPEQMIRYVEYELDAEYGGGKRLVPMTLCRFWFGICKVRTLYAHQFADVPTHKSAKQITKLEEEKISAYYGGGVLYASPDRLEPQLG